MTESPPSSADISQGAAEKGNDLKSLTPSSTTTDDKERTFFSVRLWTHASAVVPAAVQRVKDGGDAKYRCGLSF